MKIQNYIFPKSSFLSLEKDSAIIVSKILENQKLKKLLYYSDKNCLKLPDLNQDQTFSLINNQIKLIPKVQIDQLLFSYIIISYDNFTENTTNPQFRNNTINFDIICHFNQWDLGDFKLRPYTIAGEIDSMFNQQHLTGIGTLQFLGANQLILNEEFGGLSLMYTAIHGEEDKVNNTNIYLN